MGSQIGRHDKMTSFPNAVKGNIRDNTVDVDKLMKPLAFSMIQTLIKVYQ